MAGGTQALSRSLDKVLEDAQLSGVLSLHNRNLKQFPPTASKFDLSDTVTADLARNRLTELPVQVCDYGSLESLFVYHNCIRFIPDAVQFLTTLTYLDLSRNQLESIPGAICELPLEVLLLGHNRLETLPREINGLAKTLMELDIRSNHISSLPSQMGDLRKLRVLNARQNLLKELPFECMCRMNLQYLDVSSNQLIHLPVELRQMRTLIELKVGNNPLIAPPAKECTRGCIHTFKWLEIEARRHHKRAKGLPDLEWPPYRSSSLNRKGKMVQSTNGDDLRNLLGRSKVDRRPRSCRYNTIGADSGYASTVDENRWSQDMSLNGENTRRSPVGEETPPPPPPCHKAPEGAFLPGGQKSAPPVPLMKLASSPLVTTTLNGMALKSDSLLSPESKRKDKSQTHRHMRNGAVKNGMHGNIKEDTFVEEVMNACSQIGSERENAKLNNGIPGLIGTQRISGYSSSNEEGSPTPKATPNKPENFPKQFQYGSGSSMNAGSRIVKEQTETSSLRVNGVSGERMSTDSEKSIIGKAGTPPRSMRSEDIQSIYTGGASPARNEAPSHFPLVPPLQLSNGGESNCVNTGNGYAPDSIKKSSEPAITSSMNGDSHKSISPKIVESVKDHNDSKVLGSIIEQNGSIDVIKARNRDSTVNRNVKSGADSIKKSSSGVHKSTVTQTSGGFKKPLPPGIGSISGSGQMRKSVSAGINQGNKVTKPPLSGPSSSRKNSLSSSQSSLSSTASGSLTGRSGATRAPGAMSSGSRSGSHSSTGGTKGRPSKAPPAPPVSTFKSTEKFTRPRDSLGTAHSTGLKKATDPKVLMELIENMRRVLQERLNVDLPEDSKELGAFLSDGVILCNLVNQIRARVITTVHTASPTMPNLSPAKCRRNVENFLMACRRLGVPESQLCTQADILEKKNAALLAKSVVALAKIGSPGSKPGGNKTFAKSSNVNGINSTKTASKISNV